MSDKTWKAVERKIAALLGGVRVPITGRQRGATPDISHSSLSLEVKHRKELPEWILEALSQAKAASRNQIPVVILHGKGMKFDESLVVLELKDFLRMELKNEKQTV